MNLLCKKD